VIIKHAEAQQIKGLQGVFPEGKIATRIQS